MSELEKMLRGELYNANYDEEILKLRQKAQDLCFEFNQTRPSDKEKQKEIIKKLKIKTKENFTIESPFFCDYGHNIKLGENFYANHNLIILDCAKVEIGDNVFIGPNVTITTAGNPLDYKKRNQVYEYAYEIKIGKNVRIGANVVINPGVKIGDNTVIGSGSVVTKDIKENSIAFGNPCRVEKEINY